MGMKRWFAENLKLNPGQPLLKDREPRNKQTLTNPYSASRAYREEAILNRIVNIVIDSAAECDFTVGEQFFKGIMSYGKTKQVSLARMLNVKPNPFMDTNVFKRLLITDLLFTGYAFIFFDGSSLYHLPASRMEVVMDGKKYINKFVYDGNIEYKVEEIIFVKDNAFLGGETSQISGQSRVQTILSSLDKKRKMVEFKEKFVDNGTVIGLILETDEILNRKLKERKEEELQLDYNPRTGKSTVLILDGGMKAKPYSQISSFKDLDFEADLARYEQEVCTALGVPPVLIEGGNNANIRPNIDLLYYMTIIPMLNKLTSALSFFFGFPVAPSIRDVAALTPDKDKEASRASALKNNGIISINEAREMLRMPRIDDPEMDKLIQPANIAGSATGLSGQEGGRPTDDATSEEE